VKGNCGEDRSSQSTLALPSLQHFVTIRLSTPCELASCTYKVEFGPPTSLSFNKRFIAGFPCVPNYGIHGFPSPSFLSFHHISCDLEDTGQAQTFLSPPPPPSVTDFIAYLSFILAFSFSAHCLHRIVSMSILVCHPFSAPLLTSISFLSVSLMKLSNKDIVVQRSRKEGNSE